MATHNVCLILVFAYFGNIHSSALYRHTRFSISKVWPGGVIPYAFDDNYKEEARNLFLKATKKVSARTCLTFPKRQPSDKYHLQIAYGDDGGCGGSYTGRYTDKENAQILFVSRGCSGNLAVFEHELGHSIGFPHEQERMDRDDYIIWDTSLPTCGGDPPQAGKYPGLDQAALDIFYDYVSLMGDWGQCITPKLPGNITTGSSHDGSNNTFSVLDYEKMNAMYDCGGCYAYRFRNIKHLAYNTYPFVAGSDMGGKLVYICRVYHLGSILVGKGKADDHRCFIAAEGKEHEYTSNFEVMTDPKRTGNFVWVKRPDDFSIPPNAVWGGRTVDRKTVYIGRCKAGGDFLFPGSLLGGDRELYVGWSGGASKCTDYEILVCKGR